MAMVQAEDGGELEPCGCTVSSCWYGVGKTHCASHRAAWKRSRLGSDSASAESTSFCTEIDDVLGVRFCDPSKMKPPEKYNTVRKISLQYCVQGTFTYAGYEKGTVDTRWQSVDELKESCSREDFESECREIIKALQKTMKRDAKRFKTAAELAEGSDE